MAIPTKLTSLKLEGANSTVTGYVYIDPTSENLSLASASETIHLDARDVSFWSDPAKSTSMTFNYLRTVVYQEIDDRIAAVSAAETAASDALAAAVTEVGTTVAALDASLTSGLAGLQSNIDAGDALNASNLTAYEAATDGRLDAIEAFIASINQSPPP